MNERLTDAELVDFRNEVTISELARHGAQGDPATPLHPGHETTGRLDFSRGAS